MTSIKAVLIIRVNDHQLLFSKSYNKKNIDQDYQIILEHMSQINPRAEERVTLKTANGVWRYKLDENKIAYALLATESYPDRQINAMIREIEKELKKMPDYVDALPNDVEKYAKIWMKQLHEKYDNLAGVDKVYAAQQKVEEVQIVMEDNIHKMIDHGQQLENLDEKAENLKNQSKQFQQQSHELAKIMYWRNMKLKILIGLIVLAVLLYIIVPLAINASN
uniref:Synaptobrevin 9-1 n=1 Tax=Paramecium tetraurelia TaxID=5888 RepID=Q3SEQ8_PARTE|nr:synaptobrevin 9-1 [Paramecium tetraurelia]